MRSGSLVAELRRPGLRRVTVPPILEMLDRNLGDIIETCTAVPRTIDDHVLHSRIPEMPDVVPGRFIRFVAKMAKRRRDLVGHIDQLGERLWRQVVGP